MAPADGVSAGELHARFARSRERAERLAAMIARRNGMRPDEVEEFVSWARLRIMDNDYAVLRRFKGRARLATFLNVVVANLFRDYRIQLWGKWRPSAAAQRLGPVAVQLETLTVRDGFPLEEAVRLLRDNHGIRLDHEEAERIASELPFRTRRMFAGEEALARLSQPPVAESMVREHERDRIRARIQEGLARAMQLLEPVDRMILMLRFQEGWKIVDIARALELEQKPLYGRIQGLLRQLRRELEEGGVAAEDAAAAWRGAGLEMDVDYGRVPETPESVRPTDRGAEGNDDG